MEITILPDPISSITHSLSFSNPLLKHPNNLSLPSDTSSDQQPFHVTSGSPPSTRTITRRRPRTTRRVKRKSGVQEFDENIRFLDVSGDGFFGDNNNNNNNNGGNNSGGGGWNWDGFSGGGDGGDNTIYDPAFDFVYGVLCWIALSNCLVFSFKRVVRLFGDRDKVSVEMATGY